MDHGRDRVYGMTATGAEERNKRKEKVLGCRREKIGQEEIRRGRRRRNAREGRVYPKADEPRLYSKSGGEESGGVQTVLSFARNAKT